MRLVGIQEGKLLGPRLCMRRKYLLSRLHWMPVVRCALEVKGVKFILTYRAVHILKGNNWTVYGILVGFSSNDGIHAAQSGRAWWRMNPDCLLIRPDGSSRMEFCNGDNHPYVPEEEY